MSLIGNLVGSTRGAMSEQWLEAICNPGFMDMGLVARGVKQKGAKSANNGSDDIISNGSIIVVGETENAIAIENGEIIAVYTEPGENKFFSKNSASILGGDGVKTFASSIWNRFTFAGECPLTHRIIYINTAEIMGLRFNTEGSIPFRIEDERMNLDMDVSVKMSGTYSIRVTDAVKFYKNVSCKTVGGADKSSLESIMRTEILTYLQPALKEVCKKGYRPSEILELIPELKELMRERMTDRWQELRGISVVSFAIESLTLQENDANVVKEMQRVMVFTGTPVKE